MKSLAVLMIFASLGLAAVASDVSKGASRTAPQQPVISPTRSAALIALFEKSDLDAARRLAREALADHSDDVEALFVEMEAAALQADTPAELDAALRLCELRGAAQLDPRVSIAGARVANMAANTEEFRAVIQRIRALVPFSRNRLLHRHAQENYLRAALLAAAMDGVPGLSAPEIARQSGFLLDWQVAGPFGKFPNLDFDRAWPPEHDALTRSLSGDRPVERLHFDDGNFRLPEYFSRAGVAYAASDVVTSAAGRWIVRAESAGTLEILIDNVSVLRKDDRFRSSPQIAAQVVLLRPGKHRVLVKFLPSAASFRIALLPSSAAAMPAPGRIDYAPEAAYIAAAQRYWRGDFTGAISELAGGSRPQSAVADFLLAQAWARSSESSPEVASLLNATIAASATALQADYELASRACSAQRTEECLDHLQRVLDNRPRHPAANALFAQLAVSMHWNAQAAGALEMQLRVHPSCESLRQAYRFFSKHAKYARAADIEKQIASCAPDTLAYLQMLDESGRHAETAAAAEMVLKHHPLDRAAREILVRQLALSGQAQKARSAAKELAVIAPNSAAYRQLARLADVNPESVLDLNSATTRDFSAGEPFFRRYRRDGIGIVEKTKDRKFSGGPAVILLNDRFARLWDGGGLSVYVHKTTRVIDRDGIERYGEVEIPSGAQILELRTIKADGTVAEPELNSRKATISMPALSPGDAMDVEYVLHYADGIADHAADLQHTFGSFRAPILFSRFVVLTPRGYRLSLSVNGEVGPARSEAAEGAEARIWEKNDIPQSIEEVAIARGAILPSVKLEGDVTAADIRDRDRDAVIGAIRIGPQVEMAAARFSSGDPETRARAIYHFVTRNIRSSQKLFSPGTILSAEETLATGAGSRSITMLAIAQAVGLNADLALTRPAGTVLTSNVVQPVSPAVYTRPVVVLRLSGRDVALDPETDGLAFGALSPGIERRDAMLLPTRPAEVNTSAASATYVSLDSSIAGELSTADADITIDNQGNLEARATVILGAWRGSQMRGILAAVEPAQRPNFYQQLALRIFQRADQVTGSVGNEQETDRPLRIELHCRAQKFVHLSQQTADMDQLVPALGLKKMYIGPMGRSFPLYVDTPLVERATFRVHMPPDVDVLMPSDNTDLKTDFGTYSLAFRRVSRGTIEIERSFRIPVQVVPVQRYPEFARFAARIDEAERQRITLVKPAATPN